MTVFDAENCSLPEMLESKGRSAGYLLISGCNFTMLSGRFPQRFLRQMTSPDVFAMLVQSAEPSLDFNQLPMHEFRARQLAHCQVPSVFDVPPWFLHRFQGIPWHSMAFPSLG